MMKKIELYLESSALWALYYEEQKSEIVEYSIDKPNIICSSSNWTLLELQRGIQKRFNQKEITEEEAEHLRVFIETDIHRLVNKRKLILQPITEEHIHQARVLIPKYNLYASDALHLTTALLKTSQLLIVDDYHFKRLDEKIKVEQNIEVIPVTMALDDFNEIIESF